MTVMSAEKMHRFKSELLVLAIASCVSTAPLAEIQNGNGGVSTPNSPRVIEPEHFIVLPPLEDDRSAVYRQVEREEVRLNPDEIRQYRQMLLEREHAASYVKPPKLRSQTHTVSLAPGSNIPSIKIAPRYVSSLVVVDSQGNPWPIVGHNNGSPTVFQTVVPEADPHNVISISALANVGASNLAILLEGQTVPLIVQLSIDRDEMDVRADMVISELGPRSSPILRHTSGFIDATPDSTMMAFVDGVPPQGAVGLTVSDSRFRVWEYGDQLYIRTGLSISSPRYSAISHGTGGVRVYRMNKTPMILFSADGRVGTLRIELRNLRNQAGAR